MGEKTERVVSFSQNDMVALSLFTKVKSYTRTSKSGNVVKVDTYMRRVDKMKTPDLIKERDAIAKFLDAPGANSASGSYTTGGLDPKDEEQLRNRKAQINTELGLRAKRERLASRLGAAQARARGLRVAASADGGDSAVDRLVALSRE